MYLHEDERAFREFVSAAANDTGLQNFQIEKDYYASVFLKTLRVQPGCDMVFKGGTSLSKCYQIIHRFSEDLDLALQFTAVRAGDGLRKRLKQNILRTADILGMEVTNRDQTQSDRDFNRYDLSYAKIFRGDATMLPHLKIETIVAYRPYPCEQRPVDNYITMLLRKINRQDLIEKYDLSPFEMKVQMLERTFIDKLFALCDYHLERHYDRNSRHIYDIHMIWTSDRMNLDTVRNILSSVARDRQLNGLTNRSCDPGQKPQTILGEIIRSDVYKNDFNAVTKSFLFRPVTYETCMVSLQEAYQAKILPELIEAYRDASR